MVAPVFGWSAGDIVQSIIIITKICEAFRENGGAASKYAEATSFLECFKSTLSLIKDYAISGSNAKYNTSMSEQIKLIDAPYSRFESHMLKFYPVLGANSTQTRFRKIPRKIVWAVNELSEVSGKVAGLKKILQSRLSSLEPYCNFIRCMCRFSRFRIYTYSESVKRCPWNNFFRDFKIT